MAAKRPAPKTRLAAPAEHVEALRTEVASLTSHRWHRSVGSVALIVVVGALFWRVSTLEGQLDRTERTSATVVDMLRSVESEAGSAASDISCALTVFSGQIPPEALMGIPEERLLGIACPRPGELASIVLDRLGAYRAANGLAPVTTEGTNPP